MLEREEMNKLILTSESNLIREKLSIATEENRFGLLVLLMAAGKPLSYTHLKNATHLNPSSLTLHLKKLIQAGLVERIEKNPWRRGEERVHYKLTEEGKKILNTIGIGKAEKHLKEWFKEA